MNFILLHYFFVYKEVIFLSVVHRRICYWQCLVIIVLVLIRFSEMYFFALYSLDYSTIMDLEI